MNVDQWLNFISEKCRIKNAANAGSMVISNGTHRLLHCGHLRGFESMRELADNFSNNEIQKGAVYIFVDTKERVAELKPGAYCMEDEERIEMIESHKDVDRAFLFGSLEELQNEIRSLWAVNKMLYKQLIYCKGLDYEKKDLIMKDFIEKELGGKIILLPFHQKYSSSKLVKETQGML